MNADSDTLSSHRTRTNRRPEPAQTTASTAVLEPLDGPEPTAA